MLSRLAICCPTDAQCHSQAMHDTSWRSRYSSCLRHVSQISSQSHRQYSQSWLQCQINPVYSLLTLYRPPLPSLPQEITHQNHHAKENDATNDTNHQRIVVFWIRALHTPESVFSSGDQLRRQWGHLALAFAYPSNFSSAFNHIWVRYPVKYVAWRVVEGYWIAAVLAWPASAKMWFTAREFWDVHRRIVWRSYIEGKVKSLACLVSREGVCRMANGGGRRWWHGEYWCYYQ